MIGKTVKHYQIEDTLGRGGMGVVYRARDTRLDRSVAVKVLAADVRVGADRKRRFLQEARTAGSLNHPAIAQIYDVDETDEITFIVMEMIEGKTVRDLIVGQELDVQGAVEIATQAAGGLAKAHEKGIVHRDIKADNIMVTQDGHAKILDFGLAKLLDAAAAGDEDDVSGQQRRSMMETIAKTQDGMVLGTVAYMSPEQARGTDVDHRSDIFSFGVVLYEMVTGQLPFKGNSPLDTMHAIAFDETRPVTALRAHLPPSLHRVISRCLRKQPADRYQEAGALVDDLKRVSKEIESGVSQGLPPGNRIRDGLQSLKDLTPSEWAWPIAGAAVAILVLYFAFSSRESLFPMLLVLGVCGLIAYRRFRNRRYRLMKKFAARARKLKEVRIITLHETQATVIADKALAKTYVRINAWMDRINSKIFFGDRFSVVVKDGLSPEEECQALEGPGILYVRGDVLDEEAPRP